MKEPEATLFRTQNIDEASFLYTSRMKLVKLEEDGCSNKYWFVFDDRDKCEELISRFYQRAALVDDKELCDSMNTLKDMVFGRKRQKQRDTRNDS